MDEPVLYIIVRNDMASMNPGKAAAQACHAANLAVGLATLCSMPFLQTWLDSGKGFGTTIVLVGAIDDIQRTLLFLPNSDEIISGTVVDPTYPIRDGQVTHEIPITTAAYFFGSKSLLSEILRFYPLMP